MTPCPYCGSTTISFGKRIALARIRAGLSQVALARLLGKSKSSVCEYEAGEHEPPLDVIREIAKHTGVQIGELVA